MNIYKKDFDSWNEEKKRLQKNSLEIFLHEREVWWCKLGLNIGFEQDGKNSQFARPVVILKGYSINAALIVPLTSAERKGIYYFDIGQVDGRKAKAILSQVRFVDKRRMVNKIDTVEKEVFEKLRAAIIQINFS